MLRKCGNPEWLAWLKEIVEEEESQGRKSADSFRKAANSLAKCPITYQHPASLLELTGVGPGTVKKLEARLRDHCKRTGEPFPAEPQPHGRKKAGAAPAVARAQGPAGPSAVTNPRQPAGGGAGGVGRAITPERQEAYDDAVRERRRQINLGLPYGPEPVPPEPRVQNGVGNAKGKGKGKAKEDKTYVPRKGSGSYAILLALYKNSNEDDHRVALTKNKLIEEASAYADQSFTASNKKTGPGVGVYTAWSGMKTLTDKELVSTDGKRPCHYALTEPGYTLAHSLAADAPIDQHVRQSSPSAHVPWHQRQRDSSSAGPHAPRNSNSGVGYGLSGHGSGFESRGQRLGGHAGPSYSGHSHHSHVGGHQTSSLFLGDSDMNDDDGDDEDTRFAKQMGHAMRLSLGRTGSSNAGPTAATADSDLSSDKLLDELGRVTSMSRNRGLPVSVPRTNHTSLVGRKAAFGAHVSHAGVKESAPTVANIDAPFGYYYLDGDDNRKLKREDAEISQEDGSLHTLYRIEYRVGQDLHKLAASVQRKSALKRAIPLPGGTTKSGYLRERQSNTVAPGFPNKTVAGAGTSGSLSNAGRCAGLNAGTNGMVATSSSDSMSDLLSGYKPRPPKVSKDSMYAPPPEVRRFGAESARAQNAGDLSRAFVPGGHGESWQATKVAPLKTTMSGDEVGKCKRKRTDEDTNELGPESGPKRMSVPSMLYSDATSSPRASILPRPRPAESTAAPAPRPPPPVPESRLRVPVSTALARTTSSQNPLSASFSDGAHSQIINRHPLDPVRDHVASSSYVFAPFVARKLYPGTFKVILVIDMREGGKDREARLELVEALRKQGVEVERRTLWLGDMIWVARPVDAIGSLSSDDVVLDSIIERKRLDDLTHSIKDGRYASQKIRIKDSAITQRIYLIENYDNKSQYEQSGKAIWTCKSQLQVNDGFYVHESKNLVDTIAFLKLRTQIMKELWESQTLTVIPDSSIDRPTYLSLQQHLHKHEPGIKYLTSLGAFDELNRVDAALTLRRQWATMIQRVSGLSAEKAVQFVQRWETPRQFFDECRAHDQRLAIDRAAPDPHVAGPSGTKTKARKEEDFVIETLADTGPRAIKGKLGARLYHLVSAATKYVDY